MKRLFCLFTSALMVFSICCIPASAVNKAAEEAAVKETVEAYLRPRTESIYLYSRPTVYSASPKTLLDIFGSDTDTQPIDLEDETGANIFSAEEQEEMSIFNEDNAPELMQSMGRSSVSLTDLLADLQCIEDMTAYKRHVYENEGFTYTYFDADYSFGSITIDGNYAMVEAFEELNYQLTYCDDPSYELGFFNVMLVNLNGEWVVADAATDDVAFMGYFNDGYNLDKEVNDYDMAKAEEQNLNPESSSTIDDGVDTVATGNISYNKQNAVNYALTYTTSDDSGSTPSFRNTRFYYFPANCMNFCSQCVWAGFGGSNSWTDIPNKQGMDTEGSNVWWCSNTSGSNSWASCAAFSNYMNGSSAATDKGLVGLVNENTSGSNNTLPYSAQQLVGSVLHVEGFENKVAKKYAHAVFVNAATGNTRGTIMVCAYNNCHKNVPLSSVCAVGGATKAVRVIIPQTFRNGESGVRLWGDLLNVINTKTASRTIKGYSNTTLSTFKIELTNPNGGVVKTWSANNATTVSGTYNNWNMSGEWIAKMTGTTSGGAKTVWYQTIRVVLK